MKNIKNKLNRETSDVTLLLLSFFYVRPVQMFVSIINIFTAEPPLWKSCGGTTAASFTTIQASAVLLRWSSEHMQQSPSFSCVFSFKLRTVCQSQASIPETNTAHTLTSAFLYYHAPQTLLSFFYMSWAFLTHNISSTSQINDELFDTILKWKKYILNFLQIKWLTSMLYILNIPCFYTNSTDMLIFETILLFFCFCSTNKC